ncbi:hypothetical protein QZH41_014992 [Actinostola sp. cb2023]|nr:hypothetical protein QZH41_014992 [Actinostola sp. cb2023]
MSSKDKKTAGLVAKQSVDVKRLWHIWNMNGPDLSLSCEICTLLKDNQCPYELDIFLRNLPPVEDYVKDETLNRARIYAAFWKRDFESVYQLLKDNCYTNGEDLIDVWDLSHYYEEEKKKQKPLTPLTRFRIRQREKKKDNPSKGVQDPASNVARTEPPLPLPYP